MGSPAVNQNEKGTVWVDLQSVVEVVKACPACRMYIVYKCASSECHVSTIAPSYITKINTADTTLFAPRTQF